MQEKNKFAVVVGVVTVIASVLASMIVSSRVSVKVATEVADSRSYGGGAQKRVFKLGHGLPSSHPVHKGMVFMKKRLEELSDGKLSMQIYPSSQLGNEGVLIPKVERGDIAMCKTSAASMAKYSEEMSVFVMPYLFRDEDHYWATLNSEIGKRILDTTVKSKGLKGLCYYDAGARSFYFKDLEVNTPADLKGKSIRVMGSTIAMQTIEALGGTATTMNFGDVYTGLQTGRIHGAENNPPSFLSNNHSEVAKCFSINEHARIPDLLMFSQKKWEKLSDQEKEWIQQAADESVIEQRKLWKEAVKEALDTVQNLKKPVKVIYPDQKPFVEACQPMYDKVKGTDFGKLIEEIRAVK